LAIFNRYSKSGLWLLFLTTAFPIHLWTIILVLRDYSWVAERTNAWDAVGVAAYGMMFAFFESVFAFAIVTLVGFALPKQWDEKRRIAFLSLLVFLVALWAIVGQLYFLWNINLPSVLIMLLAGSAHPLRWLYAGLFALVSVTVIVPVYLFVRTENVSSSIYNFVERIAVLSAIYLVFDGIGLGIFLIRNLT
jgi:hypothetical protein